MKVINVKEINKDEWKKAKQELVSSFVIEFNFTIQRNLNLYTWVL